MLLLLSMSEEHVLTRSDLRCTDPAESTRVRRRRDGDGHHRAAVEPAAPAPVRARRPLAPARHVLRRRRPPRRVALARATAALRRRRHGDARRRGPRAPEMGQLRLPEHVLEWYTCCSSDPFRQLNRTCVSDGWSEIKPNVCAQVPRCGTRRRARCCAGRRATAASTTWRRSSSRRTTGSCSDLERNDEAAMLLKAACLALGNKLGFSVTGLCFLLPEMAVYFSATVRGS